MAANFLGADSEALEKKPLLGDSADRDTSGTGTYTASEYARAKAQGGIASMGSNSTFAEQRGQGAGVVGTPIRK
jgi:hypothetical protein